MTKYDGLLGQPVLEVEEPDKEGGITIIFKDNRFLFIKAVDKEGGITIIFKDNSVSFHKSSCWKDRDRLHTRVDLHGKIQQCKDAGSSKSRGYGFRDDVNF